MNETPLVHLEWDEARELVEQAQKIAVVTHIYPDGDAIGSLMGLTTALCEQGKEVVPFVDGGLPQRFAFVPDSDTIQGDVNGFDPDLVISTDASDKERLGDVGATLFNIGRPLIQLDHHQTNLLFGDVNLVDARTVAAAEGVLDWIDRMGWPLSAATAQCLLTGVVTDTLCFRTNNVTAAVMGKVQRLMTAGADLSSIVQRTLASQPTGLMRLYGRVLPRVMLEDGVVWATVTEEDYRAVGMEPGEYTGLSSYLVQVDDAVIAVVFTGLDRNRVDVSMRAVPGYDVSQVALNLGGGGHVLASGCTLRKTTLKASEERVIPLLKAEAQRGERVY